MAEVRKNGKEVSCIAFYLPQFHPIPENDAAWGNGFTEWTNVKRAKPLVTGHIQPKVPLEGRYYDLRDPRTQEWQARLAQEYGLFGFCYYHYWFQGGKLLLEKPAEQMLKNASITLPFCFSWANENWTRKWDGHNQDIIARQDYGQEQDWEAHLRYFLSFFRDERYITVDGKPLLLIYKPEEIPCLTEMTQYWQKRIRQEGFPGLCLMIQNVNWYFRPDYHPAGFDYQIRFQPFFSMGYRKRKVQVLRTIRKFRTPIRALHLDVLLRKWQTRRKTTGTEEQQVLDYDRIWNNLLSAPAEKGSIECAFTDWDNTPRTTTGYRFEGATPEKFGKYMDALVKKVNQQQRDLPLIFINAWNEWGEGAYLEPDEQNRFGYLEALKQALEGQKLI